MSESDLAPATTNSGKRNTLSVDAWAVIVALLLALAVRFDLVKNIPW